MRRKSFYIWCGILVMAAVAALGARISEYGALTTPAADDLAVVVDVSDTTMAASGTTKQMELRHFPISDPTAAALAGKSDTGHLHAGTYQPLDADLTTLAGASPWRLFYTNGSGVMTALPLGLVGQFLVSQGEAAPPLWGSPAGSGDVTAAATIADNALVRGDGGGKGVQASPVSVDDAGVMSGIAGGRLDDGSRLRVATSTDGHSWGIQAYDTSSAQWVDALTFVNGNPPQVLLGAVELLGITAIDLASIGNYMVGGGPLFLDEDDFASNSAAHGATQQSTKAYVDAAVAGGGLMGYPPAGVPLSTGSAWGASYTVGTAAGNLVQLDPSGRLPAVSAALLTNFPTLNQNTTGTAANLSGTPALPNGTSATTQTQGDATTQLATCAFVTTGLGGKASSTHTHTIPDRIVATFKGASALGTSERIRIPNLPAGTITRWDLAADVATTCQVDIWKDTRANYPPTDADSVTASTTPTLSAASRGYGTTLTGWTTTIADGDDLIVAIEANNNATEITLTISIDRTVPAP